MSTCSTGISHEAHRGDTYGKPLAVPVKSACEILGIGHTKMWELIGGGA